MTLPIYSKTSSVGISNSTLAAVHAYRDDGHVVNFTISGSTFTAEPGVAERLVSTTSGGYHLIDDEDNVETYDASGRLFSIADRAGNTETLTYNGSGLLASVSDNFGHALALTYDSQNRLVSVTAPDSSAVTYSYDGAGHLSAVKNLDGGTRQYLYTDPNWADGLSSVVDENGQTEFALTYDSQGRVVSSTLGGVSSSMRFVYNSDGSSTETDPFGAARTFRFQQVGDHEKSSAVTGDPCLPCGYVAASTYDSGGFPASETDFNGNLTTFIFDDSRGLERSRTEAAGTSAARTITTQWNSSYRLPTSISVYAGGGSASGTPLRTTTFTYDGSGNLLAKAITDQATNTSRTWTYTYDSDGRRLTAQDPRGNLTTYNYYTCTTGSQCGELATVTDALGHVTSYNTYNAGGLPLTITDPNGVVATLAYDPMGRLTSRTVRNETTSFSYYPMGLLEQVALPDGSTLTYAYDAAHRLTQVSDGLGNKIFYALDAMGNRTAENTFDPTGVLHRTHTRVINTLNEVSAEINAAGSSAVTTTFGYDSDGNRTSIDAPLSRDTAKAYDALNRLTSIADPAGGVSTFGYDAEDELTSVADPRGLTTSYGYDGLGDLISQVSPDTGTTIKTYDAAGNLATATDARGAVATYSYDALNRVTSVAYSLNDATDQTLSFAYDQGTNGVGHLTGASDANHSMSFEYDALGEMTGMSQTMAGITRSVAYGYTNGDLTSLTTPSGAVITYGYNANHQVMSITVNGQPLLANVTYEPFGPVNGWTWGKGTSFTRTYDGDGDITDIKGAGGEELLSYDDASRVSGVTETTSNGAGAPSELAYGYDVLDRLTSALSGTVTQGWTYDANGNRLTATGPLSSTYSISRTGNEIASITTTASIAGIPVSATRTLSYDAAGNTLKGTSYTATYNDAGRLQSLSEGFLRTSFTYNAFGWMIEASGPLGTTLYAYDQRGHLLGEYGANGSLIQETVWLGDIPVATLRPSSAGVAIYYVQTDQLNAPREVTRPQDNALLWRWCSEPFGNATPEGGLVTQVGCVALGGGGLGVLGNLVGFTYDLRFAGQIAGTWGNTYQNYQRDYDPSVGRYIESDPIGLAGGSYSTYAYASGDPIYNIDPLGLWDWPSIPDPVYNYTVGIADSLSYGIGPLLRNEYGIGGPNRCSTAYKAGEYSSLALGLGRVAYAGLARGLAAAAANGAEAAATRNLLKQIFRGPFGGSGYRLYTYDQLLEKYGTDAAIQDAAGRTSPLWNGTGADAAAGAVVNSSTCGCQQ